MKRILITGATGFIGRQCLPLLLKQGYEVHATTLGQPPLDSPFIRWHQVNLLNLSQTYHLLESTKPSHLLHFAWYTEIGKYWDAVENLHWVQAGIGLLRSFALTGGHRAVIAGTCAEYDWNYGYCSESITPCNPRTLYGTSKHVLHQLIETFEHKMGLDTTWGRVFFTYGPYEDQGRLVSSIIYALVKGDAAPCSHGNQIRDFLYVKDVADAFVTLIGKDISGPVNIASGSPLRIKDLVYYIAARLDRVDLIQLGALPTAPQDPPLLVADVRRLKEEVGWQPHYGTKRGIEETIMWWKDHLYR